MKWYCDKCKKMHDDNEMCPRIKEQLKKNPDWLAETADFVVVAGEEQLVTSQALDGVAQEINRLVGTNLTYEGALQYARDVQVFRRLNTEAFAASGHFSTPEAALDYFDEILKKAVDNPRTLTALQSKLTGSAQEVDWLREKEGELSSIIQKSELYNKNEAGVDGVTRLRLSGKEINRTTIKASKNPMTKSSTGIKDIQEAIAKGYATPDDIIYGPVGTKAAARKAGLTNRVIEKNTYTTIRTSNDRLEQKILKGEAVTQLSARQVTQQAAQGAIVGAGVSITVSALTNYARYKNGEITRDEAFSDTSEDALKGAVTGGALRTAALFLPGGPIGAVAGLVIGVYVEKTCANILDEIYGKGAYGAILDASGYVYGMTSNLADYYQEIDKRNKRTKQNIQAAEIIEDQTQYNFDIFDQMKGE